ncbi:EAL domain-containing protein [Rubeoparvulum massiliense]|uniref:EAL domain-containing protein n=1 Tax=Rubeoparvulum massiliense TaxID=1631346 RepID=UPI00065E400C|nr:EAL domain-containing protein [Rubeoparvulum massiliense]
MLQSLFNRFTSSNPNLDIEEDLQQIYNLLFEQDSLPEAVLDEHGTILLANQEFKELFQLRKVSGLQLSTLLNPSSCDQFKSYLINVFDGDSYLETMDFQLPDQQILPIPTRLLPISSKRSPVDFVLCKLEIASGVGESDLFFSQTERLDALLTTLPISLYILAVKKQQFTYLSQGVEKIWGVPRTLLQSNSSLLTQHVHPDDLAKVEKLPHARSVHETYHHTFRILQQNGEIHWILEHRFPKKDHQGEVVGLLGIAIDITNKELNRRGIEEAKQQVELLKRGLEDTLPLLQADEAGRVVHINTQFCQLTQYSAQELLTHHNPYLPTKAWGKLTQGECWYGQWETTKKDGSLLILSIAAIPAMRNGTLSGYLAIYQDHTSEKVIKELLDELQTRITHAQGLAKIGCWERDCTTDQITITPEITHILGYPSSELVTLEKFMSHVHPDDLPSMYEKLNLLKIGQKVNFVHRIIHADHSIRYVHQICEVLKDENGTPLKSIGTIQDITEQKNFEAKYRKMAYEDELTMLPNRRSLEEKIDHMIEDSRKKHEMFALLSLYVNNFSRINSNFGYEMGDRLLRKVAFRLKRYTKEHHGFVGRLFGNRFLILCPIKEIDELKVLAEGLIKQFEEPYIIDDYHLNLTINLGISTFPLDGEDGKALLKHADIAQARSSERGMNQYECYTSTMNVQSYRHFSLANDLVQAFNEHKFKVYFQPRVEPYQFHIVGAVASIYWEHPEWGVIPTQDLISLTEETGLTLPIGDWLFQQVLRQISQWQEADEPIVPISIRCSTLQFLDPHLVRDLLQLLSQYKIEPHWLELELSERVNLEENQEILRSIHQIREAGIKLTINNFGTGHSSFLFLKEHQADKLKIDYRFIADIYKNNESRFIVQSILHLAQLLKIKVVADGVTNAEQLRILQDLKCSEMKGPLFGQSMGAEEFNKLLQKGSCKPLVSSFSKENLYERRKYFRISFTYPLEANMTIANIGAKKVKVGYTTVLINDIGPGGLCFFTNVKLPLSEELTLCFTTILLGEEIQFYGHNVWTEEVQKDLYRYGVEFHMEEKEREQYIAFFNQLQVKLKNEVWLNNCSFIKIHNRAEYFKREQE